MSADRFVGPESDLDVGIHAAALVSQVPGRILWDGVDGWAESGDDLVEVVELVDKVGVVRVRCWKAAIRRRVFRSVPDLIAKIEEYLDAHKAKGTSLVWTATAEEILVKVARGRVALAKVNQN